MSEMPAAAHTPKSAPCWPVSYDARHLRASPVEASERDSSDPSKLLRGDESVLAYEVCEKTSGIYAREPDRGHLDHVQVLLALEGQSIAMGVHCFACTAGSGSSCGGSLA